MEAVIRLADTSAYQKAYQDLMNESSASERTELKNLRIQSVFNAHHGDRTVRYNVCAVLEVDGKEEGFEAISFTRANKGWERSMFVAAGGRGHNFAAIMMETCAYFISLAEPSLKFVFSHGGTRATDAIYTHVFDMQPIKWKINNDHERRCGVFKRSEGFKDRLEKFIKIAKDKGVTKLTFVVDESLFGVMEHARSATLFTREYFDQAKEQVEELSF